jgi:hypothetical protein
VGAGFATGVGATGGDGLPAPEQATKKVNKESGM